jgi:O-antigen/teichoic acid export membrane protein
VCIVTSGGTMKKSDLKQKTISGLFFNFLENFGAQLVSTVVSIILARLILPEEYGIIAIITIFITISYVFVTYGFGSSLIQNKNADSLDYSTCFFSSLAISIILYVILYISAPFIADFYGEDQLLPIIRVMGIHLIFAAVNSIQHAYIAKNLLFKKVFYVTLIGKLISGVIGIVMAYHGYGAWALVSQYISSSLIDTIVLWFSLKWRPTFAFSFKRLKKILSYGWMILATGLIDTIFNELRSLIIAKKYSPTDLAFYNRGRQFPLLIMSNINTSISTVLFPVMSNLQSDTTQVKIVCRRSIKTSSYFLFPALFGLAAIAEPFTVILFTDKWLGSVIFMQILCIYYMMAPMNAVNRNVMKSLGRSDLLLKLDILKKSFHLVTILIAMHYGVVWIALSAVLGNVFASIVNAFPSKKLIQYEYVEQIKDLAGNLILSAIMGVCVYSITFLGLESWITLLIQIPLGILIYIAMSHIMNVETYTYVLNYVKGFFVKKLGQYKSTG